MEISIGAHSHFRPRGNGYAIRVIEMPVYTYVEDLQDLRPRVLEALQLWCAGFPTTDDLLRYLDDNKVHYTIAVSAAQTPSGSEWTPMPYSEYQVAVPA